MNMQELRSSCGEAAGLLKALSNRYRLMILCELNGRECSVSALERVVPLSQSALSQHLAKLREGGLVATRREAQTIFYSLADARVARLIGVLHELFCARGQSHADKAGVGNSRTSKSNSRVKSR